MPLSFYKNEISTQYFRPSSITTATAEALQHIIYEVNVYRCQIEELKSIPTPSRTIKNEGRDVCTLYFRGNYVVNTQTK